VPVSKAFREFVLDQLTDLPDLTSRSMFGGLGLYSSGFFFGLIWNDTLFLKVDDQSRPRYEVAGMQPFNPYPGRGGTFQYYEVPLSVLESADELSRWARLSVQVARRGPQKPKRKARGVGRSARRRQ
jgi:DNA transformation protein